MIASVYVCGANSKEKTKANNTVPVSIKQMESFRTIKFPNIQINQQGEKKTVSHHVHPESPQHSFNFGMDSCFIPNYSHSIHLECVYTLPSSYSVPQYHKHLCSNIIKTYKSAIFNIHVQKGEQ